MSLSHGVARQAIRRKVLSSSAATTRRLNTTEYMNMSLMSIIGPKTRKASLAAMENEAMGAAMKASDVLHKDNTNANPMMEGIARKGLPATVPRMASLTCVLKIE